MRRRTAVLGLLACGLGCGAEQAARPARVRRKAHDAGDAGAPAEVRPAAPGPAGTTVAVDVLAARAVGLRERLGGRGFTVLVEPPFVVAGDEAPEQVAQRAASTIRWSVRRLKEAYFQADPTEVIEIYLFRDATSYLRYARELFDDDPETPYGYYSPEHDALLMNISTGGGTLVHEIVHPFLAANFPGCPAWFNEGLASLYEQCDDRQGEIVGLTNWRLPGLQSAIRERTLRTLESLCKTTHDEFYDSTRSGTNYAQARYLCHYLQEHGLLRDYYREFVATAASEPSGSAVLQRAVGYAELRGFDAEWRRYVLGLQFG